MKLTEKDFRQRAAFEVKNGQVIFDNRIDAKEMLKSLPNGEYYLLPKLKSAYRTPPQNSLIWRAYDAFATWCNTRENFLDPNTHKPLDITPIFIHEWMKKKFSHLLPKTSFITPDGELIETNVTTTKLFRSGELDKSFADYYEAVCQFASEYSNYTIII